VTKSSAAIGSAEKQQPELAAELAQALVPEVVEALVKWQVDFRSTIVFDRWLTPGLSGAQVASVALSGQVGPRKVVMKVCPPGQTTGREPTRHQQALNDGPQIFAERHLVRQPIAPVKASRGWSVMFQEIAGGSMRSVRALSALRGRQLPALAATIVSSVLADWNPAPDVVNKTPVEFLLEHLGGRLADGGPFDSLLGELNYPPGLDGSGHPRWVRTQGQRTAPNIAAWIRDRDWGGAAGQHMLALYGKAHGDLQPDNIVLPVGPQPEVDKYQLIDLSAYSAAAPLSRDPSLNDSGVGRGQLPVVSRRFSAVVSGSRVPGGWRTARCARAAPAPTAPARPPFRVAGTRVAGQAGAGRAHSRCQQARNASFQGQLRLIFSTRARAWRTSRAGRLSSR
jgi:hypothetical protein